MASNAYGRNIQAGGGTTLSQEYGYGPQDAEQYLSGELATEYASSLGKLGESLPINEKKPGKSSKKAKKLLQQKNKAKDSVGRLREIASASAVGDFQQFAEGKGRSYMAQAPKGLLTSENVDISANVGEFQDAFGDNKKSQKRLRKGLGLSKKAAGEEFEPALQGATRFSLGSQALKYGNLGTDPRANLAQTFQAIRSGQTTAAAAFQGKSKPGFTNPKNPYAQHALLNMFSPHSQDIGPEEYYYNMR